MGDKEHASEDRAKVALTFDDLPVHGALPPGQTRLDVVRGILAALRESGAAPAYGFVNAVTVPDAPENHEVLQAWRDAGHPLANHTFSHMNLHTHGVADFERDLLANEPILRALMGDEDWHWFRYPYLRAGETIEKRRAAQAMLRAHGYQVAEVTINFDDWAYHDPYARCQARGDQDAIAWLQESYLARASESIAANQAAARRAYGREIAHVLLLHAGGFNVVMLPPLLDLLEERCFDLVTLEEAQNDPVYAAVPEVALPEGATLLDQVAVAEQLPGPGVSPPPLDQLDALCR